MPQRTNLFQEVVEILHQHMAGEATVEPSAMLASRTTGALREVDVVIRAKPAGHEVIVSVEAIARSRKADRLWVDNMVGKHADLPTSKLVLVSEKGFTKDARAYALAKNAVPLAPEDLPSTNRDGDVIRAVPALWPKVVSFTIEELNVSFTDDDVPTEGWGEAATVFVEEGNLGTLLEVTKRLWEARLGELLEQIGMADRTESSVERFTFVVTPAEGAEIQLPINDVPKTLFLLNENGRGYSMRQIAAVGKGEVEIDSKIPLAHARLGDWNLNFGYGEGKIAGRDALLVVSERDEGEGNLTLRIRPVDAESDSAAGAVS